MKVEIKIVRNEAERKDALKRMCDRVMKGIISSDKITIILTPVLFAKIFSPKRIELLMILSKEEERNVTELSKLLKRQFEVVYRDLKLFEHFGLIVLHKKGTRTIPKLIGQVQLPTIAIR